MIRVLVRPQYSMFLNNRLFIVEHGIKNEGEKHWIEPFTCLYNLAVKHGVQLATWDKYPLESADIILFQDLPASIREVEEARAAAPQAHFVLQLIESFMGRHHWFLKENHRLFDTVLTYNYHLCDDKRYYHYYLPIGDPPRLQESVPFSQRRHLVMMNTNRIATFAGLLGQRQAGLTGFPLIGAKFSGWKVPWQILIRQTQGELYSRRQKLARLAEIKFPDSLDIYGYGWQGEPISWVHKFIDQRHYACAKGKHVGSKFDILPRYRFSLAFENVQADVGYISEKIFDALYSGTVPIYLGDTHINEHVPSESFIDARQFSKDEVLLKYIQFCSEEEWQGLREAGQRYLQSSEIRKFQAAAFAERLLYVLLHTYQLKQPCSNAF